MPMKANKTEPQSQTRKQKKDTPWILHIFNHICFVTTIIGCYSCHWKIKQEKKFKHGQCCSLRERLFYPCLVISFCMSVLLVFVWVESSNEYNGFDWVIFIGTGLWFFWSIVLLSFLGILAAYTSLLLVLGFLLLWEGIELYLHWCHKILILLVIVICSFFFWILFTYWKDRWLTVGLSLQEKNKLAPKPYFFGHRGAPMLGPENTIMSFEKAVEHGAYGLESDVHIRTATTYRETIHENDLKTSRKELLQIKI